MVAEITLTWGPSVEIFMTVREGWKREEALYGERRRHLPLQSQKERGGEPAISGGEWLLTERDHATMY
ncbi:hypothetical protein AB0M50_18545 [Nonomuraea fuscirosea]|uniref:hypothetical protein n=1 Tax=Nonomuraea fuscirosea TaxID=1291556 RepID=UPI002DD7E569|nr:hypothetical protein [Nonomuraea fuscirosea]WSA49672.1 hypothetical protein OIE67_37205 [Nonomuraea fuscirosea]